MTISSFLLLCFIFVIISWRSLFLCPRPQGGGSILFLVALSRSGYICLPARLSTGLFGEQIRMAIRSHPHPIILRELNSCGRKKKREDTWGYESLPYRYARRTKPTELGQPIVAQRVTLDLINTSEHLRSSCGNLRLNSGSQSLLSLWPLTWP